MSVALARVYTFTHTKVGRFTVILGGVPAFGDLAYGCLQTK